MKNALISPNESVSYVSGWTAWTPTEKPKPIYTAIPNSERVAEVSDATFPVAPPLFWVECGTSVNADQYYYDLQTKVITQIPESPPYPTPPNTNS